MAAAGTVRTAPTRKGQFGPTAEYSAPATMGPTMRAIEPAAMFSPSMAPCRSGGDERLIRDEILGMASDMPQAPIPMMTGMIQPATTGMLNRPRSIRPAGNQATGAAT